MVARHCGLDPQSPDCQNQDFRKINKISKIEPPTAPPKEGSFPPFGGIKGGLILKILTKVLVAQLYTKAESLVFNSTRQRLVKITTSRSTG